MPPRKGGRGKVLAVRTYMGRLPQKGVYVLGFSYIEGKGFHLLKLKH